MSVDQQSEQSSNPEFHKPQIENGLVSTSGKAIFESPKPEWIEGLSQIPRVEYFSYRLPGEVIRTIDLGDGETVDQRGPSRLPKTPIDTLPLTDKDIEFIQSQNSGGLGNFFFPEYVSDYLAKQIAKEFPDMQLGIRGTACSVNGPITTETLRIKSIEEILRDGTERPDFTTNATTFSHEMPEIPSRSLQWLIEHPQEIRGRLAKEPQKAAEIFPALLVYDASEWMKIKASILPDSAELRAKAILKAYVLDYPCK
jgi:hypothetical protein